MTSYMIYKTSSLGPGVDSPVEEIEAPSPAVALNRFADSNGIFNVEITDRGFSLSFDYGQFRFYTYTS